MEQPLTCKECFAKSHVGAKQLTKKTSKCIQVDMDLEEESSSGKRSSPDILDPMEATTTSPSSEHLQSCQLPTAHATPREFPSLPMLRLPLSPLPPPPSPPLMKATSLCNKALPSCSVEGSTKAQRPLLKMKPFNWQTLPLDAMKSEYAGCVLPLLPTV